MRRTGAVLVSIAVTLLGMPAVAGTAGAVGAAAGCVPTALPVPPEADRGGVATAILDLGTYLGWTGDPVQGRIWQNGSGAPLGISPYSVNSAGLAVGSTSSGARRAVRLQLGGTPEYGTYDSSMAEVNANGDAVGTLLTVSFPRRNALWWRPGDAQPTNLPGPSYTGAWAIDDLGYKVGYGETSQGERRELIWGPDGQIVRQFGPYTAGDTKIYPRDIDDGVALATRQQPNGAKDLVLVDVVTGSVSPLAGTSGLDAELIRDGWVVGTKDIVTPVLWHNGVRQNLPALPGTSPRAVSDLKVFGSTAVLAGFSYPESSGWFQTPTVWKCS